MARPWPGMVRPWPTMVRPWPAMVRPWSGHGPAVVRPWAGHSPAWAGCCEQDQQTCDISLPSRYPMGKKNSAGEFVEILGLAVNVGVAPALVLLIERQQRLVPPAMCYACIRQCTSHASAMCRACVGHAPAMRSKRLPGASRRAECWSCPQAFGMQLRHTSLSRPGCNFCI